MANKLGGFSAVVDATGQPFRYLKYRNGGYDK